MGKRIDRIIGTPEARAAHTAARTELAEVSAGTTEETDEFLAANDAVIQAEQALPKWRRGPS
jgi:hypothetical protein